MNEALMEALVAILAARPSVSAIVADRIVWDTEEIDLAPPAVALRTLATTFPGRDLNGRGGLRRAMVELAAIALSVQSSVQLLEACLAALEPYESGPAEVPVSSGTARIASINVDDVTQSPPVRERSYRQTATLIVAFYE